MEVRRIKKDLFNQKDRPFELKPIPVIIGMLFLVLVVWAYFHYRHTFSIHHILAVIQGSGGLGIGIAIALMAFLCIIPVPSEALIFVYMGIYGVGWGLFYSWIGAIIGAVIAMYLTRFFGQPLVKRFLPEERQVQVNEWVARRGTLGLFALRFAPFVPYHALNYVAGLLDVKLWPFIWTTALGIVPFDLAMGGLFFGISKGLVVWLAFGLFAMAVLVVFGFIFRKKWFGAFFANPPVEEKATGVTIEDKKAPALRRD